MVEDDGRGRLLGVELVFFGERDADLLGIEQRQQLLLVGVVGASRVAEGILAATALHEQSCDPPRPVSLPAFPGPLPWYADLPPAERI